MNNLRYHALAISITPVNLVLNSKIVLMV